MTFMKLCMNTRRSNNAEARFKRSQMGFKCGIPKHTARTRHDPRFYLKKGQGSMMFKVRPAQESFQLTTILVPWVDSLCVQFLILSPWKCSSYHSRCFAPTRWCWWWFWWWCWWWWWWWWFGNPKMVDLSHCKKSFWRPTWRPRCSDPTDPLTAAQFRDPLIVPIAMNHNECR